MSKLYVMFPEKKGVIAPEIYGHFTEHIGGVIYGGIWVGKDSDIPNYNGLRKEIVDKLKAIKAPVFRWPGGCFAEIYNWRDGIGENRPTRINWWTERDGKYESNRFGLHEFMDFCELVGAKAYVAANITSQTPLDMRDFIDYCLSPQGSTTLALEREKNGHPQPFNVKYWGIGNENWGAGGNMTPEHYADRYREYSSICVNANKTIDFIPCGQNATDHAWTRRFFAQMQGSSMIMGGFSFHYYCGMGDAINFTDEQWYGLLKRSQTMDDIIQRAWGTIKGYCVEDRARLVVDEWGAWHPDGSGPSKGGNLFEQQSTMRDALVAAITLNIFNNNCDKVMMANIAQLVNNIHALFLTEGEKCITTPTYHVFDMYKEHMGGEAVNVAIDSPKITFEYEGKETSIDMLSSSASIKDNRLTLTIANLSMTDSINIDVLPIGRELGDIKMTVLTHDDIRAYNTFENPDNISPKERQIGLSKGLSIPCASVVLVSAELK